MHKILSFLIATAFVVLPSVSNAQTMQTTVAKQAIIVDLDTGSVLLEKNANERMPTSSMSKVMTIYMVLEAIKEGRLHLSDELPVSKKAWKKGGSKMFVEVGKKVKVQDLIRGVAVQSGNDATIVLAEGIAGSEDVFAQTMTMKAQEIGMKNSQFMNASGWPNPDHYSTARDLATLSERLIQDFPEYYSYFGEKEFTYSNIKQSNRNPLLFRNMGVDGIKTGHTDIGGYGLMASGVRGDRRIVVVVNGLENEKARANESARLMEWGFRSFENKTLLKSGQTIETAEVFLGQAPSVSLVIDEDVRVTLPKVDQEKLKVTVSYEEPFMAPVIKGAVVGKLRIEMPGMFKQEYDLKTGEHIPELGFLPKTMAKAKYFLLGSY